jgi:hypothetical protein
MARVLTGIMDAVATALTNTGSFGEVLQYDVVPQLEPSWKFPVCVLVELTERLNGRQDDECEDRTNLVGIALYSNKMAPADRVTELRDLAGVVYEAVENKVFGQGHPAHWQRKDTAYTSNMVPLGVRLDVYDLPYHLDRGNADES